MKKLVRAACLVCAGGFVLSAMATDARIITMGRQDNFFMDEWSIFRNPANLNYYPNMLMGSFGVYKPDTSLDADSSTAAWTKTNRDPQRPFFGGIVSYSLNQSEEGGNQYPMISFGGVFNRHDPMLNYITPGTSEFQKTIEGKGITNIYLPEPIGKIDLMAGYALANGGMFGVGTYMAFQNERNEKDLSASLFRGTVGLNWPLLKSIDLEVSCELTAITAIGDTNENLSNTTTLADNDISFKADARIFSAMTLLNGDLVPHVGFELINVSEYSSSQFNGGLGLNVNIDKGFFWAGAEFLYEGIDMPNTTTQGVGGRIGFGIERNVFWDWFVLRVGVNKSLLYVFDGENSYWKQNPEADASDNDLASLGIGLNIENRLKIDAVLAEDVIYTFTNLISGTQHHLTNRITVTYSF